MCHILTKKIDGHMRSKQHYSLEYLELIALVQSLFKNDNSIVIGLVVVDVLLPSNQFKVDSLKN